MMPCSTIMISNKGELVIHALLHRSMNIQKSKHNIVEGLIIIMWYM